MQPPQEQQPQWIIPHPPEHAQPTIPAYSIIEPMTPTYSPYNPYESTCMYEV
jgi:hypothetical protein